jgi:N6-adenosine-specific RNA methylase IME4
VIVVDPPWAEYSKRAQFYEISKDLERSQGWPLR